MKPSNQVGAPGQPRVLGRAGPGRTSSAFFFHPKRRGGGRRGFAQHSLVLWGFLDSGRGAGTGSKAPLHDAPARGHEGPKPPAPEQLPPGAALVSGRGTPAPPRTPGCGSGEQRISGDIILQRVGGP